MTKPTDKKPPLDTPSVPAEETTAIELMSTTILRKMLDTDEVRVDDLEATALSDADGMLGRDENGNFEVLEKNSLDHLMSATPGPVRRPTRSRNRPAEDFDYGNRRERAPEARPAAPGRQANVRQISLPESGDADDLELVDTQMLRVILDEQLVAQGKKPKFNVEDVPDANPYDSAKTPSKSQFAPEGRRSDDFNPYNSSSKKR